MGHEEGLPQNEDLSTDTLFSYGNVKN